MVLWRFVLVGSLGTATVVVASFHVVKRARFKRRVQDCMICERLARCQQGTLGPGSGAGPYAPEDFPPNCGIMPP